MGTGIYLNCTTHFRFELDTSVRLMNLFCWEFTSMIQFHSAEFLLNNNNTPAWYNKVIETPI